MTGRWREVADSKILQILQAFKTKLQTITIANGYNFTLKKVTYGFVGFDNVKEHPTVCLVTYPIPFEPLTNSEYTSGGGRNTADGWRIGVIGYVDSTRGEEDLTDQCVNLIEDIIEAMLADHTLGLSAFVNNCYLVNADWAPNDENTKGTVIVYFDVKYDFPKTAA